MSCLPPRLGLGCFPTPLHHLANLSADLNIDLWIKRDDLTGLAAGGNKIRKLEYLLAEAKQQNATTVITAGAIQSNHVLQTIASAKRSGMRAIAVLQGIRPATSSGNLLLDELLGAEIEYLDSEKFVEDAPAYMARRQLELGEEGERVYIVPVGGSNALGAIGYVNCSRELAIQYQDRALTPPDFVVAATGSVGTYAGLVVGCAQHWPKTKVMGVVVTTNYFAQRELVTNLVNQTARLARFNRQWSPDELLLTYNYIGPGYGIPSNAGNIALSRVAESEGILLDPTYTGKVFSGLIDSVKSGQIPLNSKVLFLHTGGSTALLA
ncbi:D-cysteine desulfhydrase family protein [Comamonas testosteroni]|uniref:D-cysteine desulfhydrase family protein n=1 Tax=Comamonas testosteroni TaxID=285 RepID=UPI00389B0CB9